MITQESSDQIFPTSSKSQTLIETFVPNLNPKITTYPLGFLISLLELHEVSVMHARYVIVFFFASSPDKAGKSLLHHSPRIKNTKSVGKPKGGFDFLQISAYMLIYVEWNVKNTPT
jgi:hypothetical protein